ncbi:uncharacterized protein CCDC197 [Pelobates fuscus]|uniref:uncharacterized protein CCDC197 n=1 Tax=Pelobates fuscus TaxID=191477 RepID=UPI002FE45F7B
MTDGGQVQHIGDNPKYELNVNGRGRNVFVTQLEDGRNEEEEIFTQSPVIKETPGRIPETTSSTLQKTLILKKEVEYDQVSQELQNKRQEFEERMLVLDVRRQELAEKQLQCSDQAVKFDKFLKDSDAKRRRAIVKYQTDSRQNELRKIEIEELARQLGIHKIRQLKLHEMVKKNKIYEDFLLKMVDIVPENYLEYGMDSPVKAIIRRHETLSLTNESLINNLTAVADEQENKQHLLDMLQRSHDTSMLTMNSDLSRLQLKFDQVREKNKQLELNFNLDKGHFRNQSVEVGSLLMAVTNLAETCHLKHYGPIAEVELLQKMDMIKEFILEKMHIEKLAGPLITNSSDPSIKYKKTSIKNVTSGTKEGQLHRNNGNKCSVSIIDSVI